MLQCKCDHAWCPIRDIFMFTEYVYENGKRIGFRNSLPNYQRLLKIHVEFMKKEALDAKIRTQKAEQKARKEKWLLSQKI